MEDYLQKTLAALREQTLSKSEWELILVDNASKKPLSSKWNLSWHPRSRIVREEKLGLTAARLTGIAEAAGEILVFVDDDNVLAPDYLAKALQILATHPFLGAIGGRIDPVYESECPAWFKPYQRILAVRQPDKARWSNAWDDWQSQPWGAGMIVRKEVCKAYARLVAEDKCRQGMDRAGESLFSGGDTDLILTCLDLNLGYGVFPELLVKHLIPSSRTHEEYVLKLVRGLNASNLWLKHLRGYPWQLAQKQSWYTHLRGYYHFLKRSRIAKKIEEATLMGQSDFLAKVKDKKYS